MSFAREMIGALRLRQNPAGPSALPQDKVEPRRYGAVLEI
jgi:hypothetical protein